MALDSGAARFARTRGRATGSLSNGTVHYPTPFFDIGHTYLPTSVKELFHWCRYYFYVHPLINTTVTKLSQYPITDIFIQSENDHLRDQWRNFLEDDLQYRTFQLDSGLDYWAYGNMLASIAYPFKKMLTCENCSHSLSVKQAKYQFRTYKFFLDCPKCQHNGEAKVVDHYIRNRKGIRLLRWNPEDIDIRYNDLNGEYTYYYEIPSRIKNDIMMGRRDTVENIPQLFIEALRRRKSIVFSKDNIFHMRRPTLAGKDRGWGTPLILPVLKDAYYLQLLKKSQESIMLEHIVPLRIMFPQAGSGSSDPYSMINLSEWQDQVRQEIQRWRIDSNYIPVLPLPIGNQSIGGDGRALMLGQEIRVWSEQLVIGMGVPIELIFGGVSWSGTNVSLRMLENLYLGYMQDHYRLLQWVIRNTASYLNWEIVSTKFKPFKMADDLQRKAYNFQLNQAGKISDEALLRDADFDPKVERETIIKETNESAEAMKKTRIAQAEIEGQAQMIMSKYQMKAQMESQQMMQQAPSPGEPGAEAEGVQQDSAANPMSQMESRLPQGQAPQGGANVDIRSLAMQIAQHAMSMDPQNQQALLANVGQQNPELLQLVQELMKGMGNAAPQGGGQSAAGQPLPEQRPPRRDVANASI